MTSHLIDELQSRFRSFENSQGRPSEVCKLSPLAYDALEAELEELS